MIKHSLVIFAILLIVLATLGYFYLWFNRSLPVPEEREQEPSEADVVGRMDELYSEKELGAILLPEKTQTVFRVFSPRAEEMDLCILSEPVEELTAVDENRIAATVPMARDEQGVWEAVVDGLLPGRHYLFRMDGPGGEGSRKYVGDPYARAVAHAGNSCIVIDPNATNRWFSGWGGADYESSDLSEVVIYNTHVRDFTAHPSSGVPKKLRGTFRGVPATRGTKSGIDHMKELGANTLGLMPVSEFANGKASYGWGYSPAYAFAPEASYGTEPLEGSQYYELKGMIASLHSEGVGVVIDVSCARAGESNPLLAIDRLYYQQSGGGEENGGNGETSSLLRTEAPMVKRLILDNARYWIEEFRVDGVHFHEADELSMESLAMIAEFARDIDPDFALIADGEGFSGIEKQRLLEVGWQVLNPDFCDKVRSFVMGQGGREFLGQFLAGGETPSASKPFQNVNSISTPEKTTLADALGASDLDYGGNLTPSHVKRNTMAATLLLTAPGVPMLNGGQDFLRSNNSMAITSGEGDRINAIHWNNRRDEIPKRLMRYYRGLIRIRQSEVGSSLRNSRAGGEDSCEVLMPEDESLLGFVVNPSGSLSGNPMILLVNTAEKAAYFEVPFPAGRWRLIGDGNRIAPSGLPGGYSVSKKREKTVLMPALSSRLFIRR